MGINVTSKYFKGDRIIWMLLIALSVASLLVIYSSTGALAFRVAGGNTWYYLFRQMIMHTAGILGILFMINFLPVKFYNKAANIGFFVALFFVVLGLVFGRDGEGTGRTLPLGAISFQPAEFAKVAVVIWVARILANHQKNGEQLKRAFKQTIIGAGLVCGVIAIADFSTASLLFATVTVMMFVGRIPWKYMIGLGLAGIGLIALIYVIAPHLPDSGGLGRIKTARARIERYVNGDERSQKGLTQSDFAKIAIHRGGFTGKGAGDSLVSNFMSAAYNDFIYSIIIEEYGMLGGIIVLLFYLILLTRGGIIVRNCSRTFPAFLATGVTTLLVLQAMINMGVSVGVLPVTGQPLPWVSWGGTSQLFTAVSFGLLLSISSQNNKERKEEVEQNFNPGLEIPDEDLLLLEE
jgi:cell division protein FtsW